jgi:hypothetical protein
MCTEMTTPIKEHAAKNHSKVDISMAMLDLMCLAECDRRNKLPNKPPAKEVAVRAMHL